MRRPVHTLALAAFIGWMIAGAGWEHALTIAIAVLIITCPCALALAVPAVQVAASARLFDRGILLKSADGLERLAETDIAVFDKTGTLTAGVPSLANGAAIDDETLKPPPRWPRPAAILMRKRLCRRRRSASAPSRPPASVEETAGFGLKRVAAAGEERLGSAAWCSVDAAQAPSASLWFARPGAAPVAFAFEDKLREDAAQTVDALHKAKFRVSLLSGDRAESRRGGGESRSYRRMACGHEAAGEDRAA